MTTGKKRGVLAWLLVIAILVSSAMADTLKDSSEEDFNKGSYENTAYEDGVKLSEGNTAGRYLSRAFDAGSRASWQGLSWNANKGTALVLVDVGENVYKSLSQGEEWLTVNDDFNSGTVDAVEIVSASEGALYIVDLLERMWSSADFGHSWEKVNEDYNGLESSNAVVMAIDSSNSLYIFEDDEDVWLSEDSGATFTKVNDDFDNSSEGSNARGASSSSKGELFVVASNSDVYASKDKGVTWTEVVRDYNGDEANLVNDLAIDKNDSLYIINGQSIWSSSDYGLTWAKSNSDFNSEKDGNDGKTIAADANNYLYIVDASEDVYRSADFGITWGIIADDVFSGDVKSMASYTQPEVKFHVRGDNDNADWPELAGHDGASSSYYTTPGILNVQNNRYFQYAVYFERADADYAPKLTDVTISYTDLPPAWSENTVELASFFAPDKKSWVQLKWEDGALENVFIESNYSGTAVNYTAEPAGEFYRHEAVMPAGTHYWKSIAKDKNGNWNETPAFAFTIAKAKPVINLAVNNQDGDIVIATGQSVNIIANVSGAEGILILYEDGAELDSDSSTLTFLKTYEEPGTYGIRVVFAGSENYEGAEQEFSIAVKNPESSVSASSSGGGGGGGSRGGRARSSSGFGANIFRASTATEEKSESTGTPSAPAAHSSSGIIKTEFKEEGDSSQAAELASSIGKEIEDASEKPLAGLEDITGAAVAPGYGPLAKGLGALLVLGGILTAGFAGSKLLKRRRAKGSFGESPEGESPEGENGEYAIPEKGELEDEFNNIFGR